MRHTVGRLAASFWKTPPQRVAKTFVKVFAASKPGKESDGQGSRKPEVDPLPVCHAYFSCSAPDRNASLNGQEMQTS